MWMFLVPIKLVCELQKICLIFVSGKNRNNGCIYPGRYTSHLIIGTVWKNQQSSSRDGVIGEKPEENTELLWYPVKDMWRCCPPSGFLNDLFKSTKNCCCCCCFFGFNFKCNYETVVAFRGINENTTFWRDITVKMAKHSPSLGFSPLGLLRLYLWLIMGLKTSVVDSSRKIIHIFIFFFKSHNKSSSTAAALFGWWVFFFFPVQSAALRKYLLRPLSSFSWARSSLIHSPQSTTTY